MYQTNPTEMFRERQLALRREVQERRHFRSSRVALPKRSPRSGWRRMAAFRRTIALLGRTSTPFFRA
jgi:hypothetical protein